MRSPVLNITRSILGQPWHWRGGTVDGIELASLVRTAWPGIKALLTSSHRNADQFRLTVLKDFVAKPWNETALVDRIRLALAA